MKTVFVSSELHERSLTRQEYADMEARATQPGYRSQRPIIVDEALESPETVTLRYEEEAAVRSNGGDLRGESPPGLLPMSGYKSQPPQLHGECSWGHGFSRSEQ